MHSMAMQRVKQLLPFQRSNSKSTGVLHLTSTPMSPAPFLPAELIEAIVDELGALHDTATLRACALVSHTFLFPSQKYLFYSINLDRPHTSRKKTVQRFHKLLLSRPHVGTHVRALYLGDDTADEYGYEDDDIGSHTVSSSELWVPMKKGGKPKSLQLIPQILDRVPRLAALSVSFNPNMLRWGDIPPQTLEALYGVLERESLREVALSFVPACPSELLYKLARLKVVNLSCVELDSHHAGAITSEAAKTMEVNIETLILRATPPSTILALARMLATAPKGSSPLKSLAVTPTFEPGFCEAVAELIARAGENLVNFEWLPSIHFSASSHPIALSRNTTPHLTSLRFCASFRKSQMHAGGPFVEVLRILEGLRPPTPPAHPSSHPTSPAAISTSMLTPTHGRLRTITIDCHCLRPTMTGTYNIHMGAVPRKLQAEWAPLDHALSALVGLGSLDAPTSITTTSSSNSSEVGLREVRIRLSTKTSAALDRHRFVQLFPLLMPRLQSRGVVLSVTTSDDLACQ